jgi:hypothetical protein
MLATRMRSSSYAEKREVREVWREMFHDIYPEEASRKTFPAGIPRNSRDFVFPDGVRNFIIPIGINILIFSVIKINFKKIKSK